MDCSANGLQAYRSLRRAGILLYAVLAACLPGQRLRAQVGETESRIGAVRRAIVDFMQTHGQLPGSIEDLCKEGSPCRFMPISQDRGGLRDGWGRPILYRQVEGEYELRSTGPDGNRGNADDLVFRPSWEHARVEASQGFM